VATLTYLFAQMGAGKTEALLSAAYQLRQADLSIQLLTTNDRTDGHITSRMGLSAPAISYTPDDHMATLIPPDTDHVLIDEAQFLTPDQVDQLTDLVDHAGIDITCYGLRTDFTTRVFDGAARLFATADTVAALQSAARCWCGHPAVHNGRTIDGQLVTTGAQIVIDNSDEVGYEPLCRPHYRTRLTRTANRPANATLADTTAK